MRVAESGSAAFRWPPPSALQWGRNMRVAESATIRLNDGVKIKLQWGRNMRVAESRFFAPDPPHWRASMGPQHESCGKSKSSVLA